jgi:hypothetical protein
MRKTDWVINRRCTAQEFGHITSDGNALFVRFCLINRDSFMKEMQEFLVPLQGTVHRVHGAVRISSSREMRFLRAPG